MRSTVVHLWHRLETANRLTSRLPAYAASTTCHAQILWATQDPLDWTSAQGYATFAGHTPTLVSAGQPFGGTLEPISTAAPAISQDVDPLSSPSSTRPVRRGFAKEVGIKRVSQLMPLGQQ